MILYRRYKQGCQYREGSGKDRKQAHCCKCSVWGNPEYFFWTGDSTPKSAVSYFDKLYRQVFKQAGIPTDGKLSHRFRHTFSVELLKAGVDIRTCTASSGETPASGEVSAARQTGAGKTSTAAPQNGQNEPHYTPKGPAQFAVDTTGQGG